MRRSIYMLLLSVSLVSVSATCLLSQEVKPLAAPEPTASSLAASPQASNMTTKQGTKQGDTLVLLSAACFKRNPNSTGTMLPDDCGLGKNIVLTFDNLPEWMKQSPATHTPQSLLLMLNGKLLKGVAPTATSTSDGNELQFELKRLDLTTGDQDSTDNRATWNQLMSMALLRQFVKVAVIANGGVPSVVQNPVVFRILPWFWPEVSLFMGALLVVFLILARSSDILRDRAGPASSVQQPWWKFGIGSGPKCSYSLARCQMAWWFFIILTSFLYIWMIFNDTETLTPGALILMGISAATGFSSFMVDSSKEDSRKSLSGEGLDLTTQINDLTAVLATVPADPNLIAQLQQKQARLTQVSKDLGSLPSPIGLSQGFLKDILQDETGVSFHRFQLVAWTLVLGFVFLIAVYQKLAMPDFSPTLLGLVGISSGTYIGFKIPNQSK